ncbi:alpha/beta hydrolase [Archangium gephyra]|uniref:alpha/beta hydrolase n=1 Tax=Archangium gephyra TaxID=48 RepID=UPI00064AD23B|nr:alpha/beta hydrolase-fold protein [Archangium gephyra]
MSALCWAIPAAAVADTAITFGTRTALRSEVLGEERPLWVSLPERYADSPSTRYPVLYVLDGESHFLHVATLVQFLARHGNLPEMIVVGVPNTDDRVRDFTPPPLKTERIGDGRLLSEASPTAGGADRFLRFLTEELVPDMDARYRTQPYRVLVGHSLGGLFAVHALVHKPESFHAYLAIEPSLHWNSGELARRAPEVFSHLSAPARGLYVIESVYEAGISGQYVRAFAKALRQRKLPALTWRYDEVGGEDHSSIPHRGTYDGLRFFFSGWKPAEKLRATGDLAQLEAHYAGLTRRVGYPVQLPEQLLNRLGYRLLQEKRISEALVAFERNVALYSDSANAYDSLGEGLEAAGRLQESLASYERALALAREHENPDVPLFQKGVDRLRARLAAQPPAR